jgi:hypothetical protein
MTEYLQALQGLHPAAQVAGVAAPACVLIALLWVAACFIREFSK